MSLPLSGVKVIAFEQYGAGPFGTQYLADMGADVIKVEPAGTSGDYLRDIGPVSYTHLTLPTILRV